MRNSKIKPENSLREILVRSSKKVLQKTLEKLLYNYPGRNTPRTSARNPGKCSCRNNKKNFCKNPSGDPGRNHSQKSRKDIEKFQIELWEQIRKKNPWIESFEKSLKNTKKKPPRSHGKNSVRKRVRICIRRNHVRNSRKISG